MALGLGEGGEQNAPLGRAVIGGLIFATAATLLFVPVVFSIIHGCHAAKAAPTRRGLPSLERLMPDKNPDAGPPVDIGRASAGGLAAPQTPPGLKRWGKLAGWSLRL